MSLQVRSFAATDAGPVRRHNEDAFADCPLAGLWAVADGAGGHAAGDVASAMLINALQTLPAALPPDEALAQLRMRTAAVHAALRSEANLRDADVMATTIVILLVRGEHFLCLWAGDSRAYLLRGGALQQISRDHSLVQDLLDRGLITHSEAERHPQANVITRAIGGPDGNAELDKAIGAISAGDRFILCSDGVSKVVDGDALIACLAADGADPAARLVAGALQAGSRDNVTAVVVDILPAPAPAEPG